MSEDENVDPNVLRIMARLNDAMALERASGYTVSATSYIDILDCAEHFVNAEDRLQSLWAESVGISVELAKFHCRYRNSDSRIPDIVRNQARNLPAYARKYIDAVRGIDPAPME